MRTHPDPHPEVSDLPLITEIGSSRPLARRAHICSACGLPIAIGTRYERILYRDDTSLDPHHSLRVAKLHLPICPPDSPEVSYG